MLELHDEGDTTVLRYLQSELPPAYLEFVLGSWVAISGSLPEVRLPLLAVNLTHTSAADTRPQRSLFGEQLRFGARW